MNPSHPTPEELVRLIEGEHAQAGALREHLDACPECRQAEQDMRLRIARFSERSAGLWPAPKRSFAPRPRRSLGRKWLWVPAAAAVLLAVVIFWPSEPSVAAKIEWSAEKHPGEMELLEGSLLDAHQALRLRFTDGTSVHLDKGASIRDLAVNGFFMDTGRAHVSTQVPGFTVGTPRGRIKDLGTVFEVRIGAGQDRVIVIRGSVRVEPETGADVQLSEGFEAVLKAGSAPLSRPLGADADPAAWVRKLHLPDTIDNRPLDEIFSLIEQTSPYEIEAPQSVRDMRVTGRIAGLGPEELLQTFADLTETKLELKKNRAVFSGPDK